MSKKKVLLRGVFINRDTNGEGVLKVGTTLIRVSTVMGILYTKYNYDGKAVISENDEWRDEKEWDEVFEQMQKLVVTISLLLPILLLTGSNNLLNSALICHNL